MTDIRQYDTPTSEMPGTTQTVKEEAAQVASTAVDQGRQTAAAAAEAVGQTAGTAAEGAKEVASEAAQQVTEVARQASEQARDLVAQAESQLHEQASAQTQRAAGGLADVGRQIRALVDGHPDQAGVAADAARQLAGKVEQLAGRLEQRGFDGAVADLRNFARRRPGAFLLSAAATGFVVGRLGRGAQVAQESQDSTPPQRQSPSPALPVPAATDIVPAPDTELVPPVAAPLVPPPAAAFGEPAPYVPGDVLPEFDGGS